MTLGLNEICDNGNNINISCTGILDESKYEGVKKYSSFKKHVISFWLKATMIIYS